MEMSPSTVVEKMSTAITGDEADGNAPIAATFEDGTTVCDKDYEDDDSSISSVESLDSQDMEEEDLDQHQNKHSSNIFPKEMAVHLSNTSKLFEF